MAGQALPIPKLAVRGATKRYGDLTALEGCSFDVADHSVVSIVGPSGCGKTTLLWSMSGLHGLTSGEVRLDETPITGPHPDIGLVFQEANLLPWRNLMQNILFAGIAVRNEYRYGKSRRRDFDYVTRFLDTLYASGRLTLPLQGILVIGY